MPTAGLACLTSSVCSNRSEINPKMLAFILLPALPVCFLIFQFQRELFGGFFFALVEEIRCVCVCVCARFRLSTKLFTFIPLCTCRWSQHELEAFEYHPLNGMNESLNYIFTHRIQASVCLCGVAQFQTGEAYAAREREKNCWVNKHLVQFLIWYQQMDSIVEETHRHTRTHNPHEEEEIGTRV